jgi:hypothetical protein
VVAVASLPELPERIKLDTPSAVSSRIDPS